MSHNVMSNINGLINSYTLANNTGIQLIVYDNNYETATFSKVSQTELNQILF